MLPALPRPLRHCVRMRRALLVALIAARLCAATTARALEVDLDEPQPRDQHLWVNLTLRDVISDRVEESLTRGMPATLQFHVELWRKRGGWFDRLESSFDGSLKIRYEVWNGLFRLEHRGRPTLTVSTLDSLRTALARPIAIPVGRIGLLQPGPRYYVLVSVTLKPLSVEDIEEGEGWLSGEVENKRRAGFGIITAIPRSLFDAVRNFSGFGDQHARSFSREFDLETLFPP